MALFEGSILILLAVLAVINTIPPVTVCSLLYFMKPVNYLPVYFHQLSVCFLYYFVTPMIGGLMGMALVKFWGSRRLLVYPVVLLLVVLSTSYLDQFLSTHFVITKTYGFTHGIYAIKDFLTFTPYGLAERYGTDGIYGVPQEAARWLLAGLWTAVLGLICFLPVLLKKKSRLWLGAVAGIVAVACLTGYCFKGTVQNLDNRPEGLIYDQQYYLYKAVKEDAGGFTIQSYNMELTILQKLYARVAMQVSALDEGKDAYTFTLYHSMGISSLEDGQGRKIPFKRQGDIFSISKADMPADGRVTLCYSGSHLRFYSGDQAVVLPAYFPFYPMAGIHPIYQYYGIGGGYFTKMCEDLAHFEVKIKSGLTIYSNLAGSANTFSGDSQGLTLYGSKLIREYPVGGCTLYLPGMLLDTYREFPSTIENTQVLLDTMNQRLGNKMPPFILQGKKIFILPTYFSATSQSEDTLFMDDYLLLSLYSALSPETIAAQYLDSLFTAEHRYSVTALRYAYAIANGKAELAINNPPDRLVEMLDEWITPNESPDAPHPFDPNVILDSALTYLSKQNKENYMMRIYDYLTQNTTQEDEMIFIRDLIKEAAGK